ncbi:MAG: hypothetical protein H7645_11685 [Candidatus Heimdallarchaeota archaeon]|nr:hypothetical protein [Candidatus Heimdallarchaeota archaeon]MCK4770985.1 hypothetical protein [Candidatus Heimdallarchaeota archaeon]
MSFVLFIFIFLFFSSRLLSINQVNGGDECSENQIDWVHHYSGQVKSGGSSIIQTSDGGFVGTGNDYLDDFNDDVLLFKTDSEGLMIWNKTFGGTDSDRAREVIKTKDGGFALAGSTSSFGCCGVASMYLIKTDSEGNKEWEGIYGGLYYDAAYSLVQTEDNGFVLAGFTNSFGAGQYDAYLIKTDSMGIMEWNHTYSGVWSGTQYDGAYDVIQTHDGGFALAGFTSFGYPDMFLVKVDSEGEEEWIKSYGGLDSDTAYAIVQTNDNGFALAGFTKAVGSGESDMLLVKTDSDGQMEWYQTYGGPEYENAHALIQTIDGGFALAGSTSSGDYDMFFVKTNSTGSMEWNCTYGGENADGAFSLIQTSNISYVILGSSTTEPVELFTLNNNEFWLLKIKDPSSIDKTTSNLAAPLILSILMLIFYKLKNKKKEGFRLLNYFSSSF